MSDQQNTDLASDVRSLEDATDRSLFNEQAVPSPDDIIERRDEYKRGIGQPSPGGRYKEMRSATPMPKEEFGDETFEGGREGLRKAAEERAAQRTPTKEEWQAQTPVPVEYQNIDTREVKRPDETVSREQAVYDLANYRRGLAEQELDAAQKQALAELDAQASIDPALAEAQAAGLQPEQTPVQEQPAQPEQPVDELTAELQRSPRLLAAVQEEFQQQAAQVEAAKAQYVQSLAGNAQTALAAAVTQFPELRSVNNINEIPLAINIVAQSNPQRAQAMAEAVKGTVQTLQDWQNANVQYQRQQEAQYQDRWNKFAKDEDSKFEQKYPDLSYEIQKGALEYLHNIGFSDDDLTKSWNGQYSWSPRDARVQEIIRDASLYRQAQRGAQQKTVRQVPTIQRPGSPVERQVENAGPAVNSAGYVVRSIKGGALTPRQAADALTNQRRRA